MRVLAALFFVVTHTLAQNCGPDEIPDKLAISHNGEVALGCRYNECPAGFNDPTVKGSSRPKCTERFFELSCEGPLAWVGGIPKGSNLKNVVPLRCCSAQSPRDAPVVETNKLVQAGQVFEGQVHHDKSGNVVAYEIIKNVEKIQVGKDDEYGLSLTVARLNCESKRAAQFDAQEVAFQGFGDPLAAPAEDEAGVFQGPLDFQNNFGGQQSNGAGVFQGPGDNFGGQQFGGQFAPQAGQFGQGAAAPAGLGLGAASAAGAGGAGACFNGDTMVQTPSGPKRMDALKIGDQVLTVRNKKLVGFSEVRSFLHRLPEKEVNFQKITAGGSSVTLTPMHFIFTTPCHVVTPMMKWAQEVQPGKECLLRVDGERLAPVEIESNEVVRDTGIYNPMTEAGTIVADGFMASIHNVFDDACFMNTFMKAALRLQTWLTGESSDNHVELPYAVQYAIDYANKLF